MPTALRTQLQSITESFVAAIMTAMKGASLGDLSTEMKPKHPAAGTATGAPKQAPVVSTKAAAKRKVAKPAKTTATKPSTPKSARANGAAKPAPKFKLAVVKDQVLAYVKAHANERSEKIRAALELERPVYLRATAELVAEKRIAKKGEKRKTTFSVVG